MDVKSKALDLPSLHNVSKSLVSVLSLVFSRRGRGPWVGIRVPPPSLSHSHSPVK